jgi:hypothetical protein
MRVHAPHKVASSLFVLLTAACGGDSTSPPAPSSVRAAASSSVTGTVGSTVAAPSVVVTGKNGAPISGVAVSFAVTAGGGTLGRTSATTDATGTASSGSWTLGTTAGTQSVDATVQGLAAVRFSATATAAAAASLAVSSGDQQQANVGDAVTTAPAVVLKDAYGNVVAGATVTFSVLTGGGAVTGATATTGADGIAHAGGWTLGIATGAQTLRAASGTLTATFTATGKVPTGCTVTNYALGATLALNWDADDCTKTSGRRYDRLQFTTTAQQQVEASVNGANGRQLYLRDTARDLYVGLQPGTAFSPTTQNPMKHKYVLAPGTYQYESIAPDANTTGTYTFSTVTGTKIDCDYIVFASPNVQFTDSVSANSCIGPTGGREQWINLQLKTGMKMRLTLSGADFPAVFLIRDDRLGPASPTLVSKTVAAGATSVIDWTATFDTWHEVIVATLGGYGKYTLKIEQLP